MLRLDGGRVLGSCWAAGLRWSLSRGFAWQMTMCFPFGNFSAASRHGSLTILISRLALPPWPHVSKAWTAPPAPQASKRQAAKHLPRINSRLPMLGIPLGRVGARSTVCEDERGRFSSNLPVLGFSRSPNRASFTPPTHMYAVFGTWRAFGRRTSGHLEPTCRVCPVICLRHASHSDH